ncbi:MAG: hypothetical protein IPQ27_08520 [Chitinophagaceae bacterium]|nr:hypothetical protein [Chitinophagaceae bacterium]
MKTKTYFFIIFLAAASATAYAQHPLKYDTCNTLQQYEGEWMNVSGADTIRIYLKPVRTYSQRYNTIRDLLWGWVEYKQGNNIVMSNYANQFLPTSDSWSYMNSITNFSLSKYICNSQKLDGLFSDLNHHRGLINWVVEVTLSANDITMDVWQQRTPYYNFNLGDTAITLPQRFTLIKQ